MIFLLMTLFSTGECINHNLDNLNRKLVIKIKSKFGKKSNVDSSFFLFLQNYTNYIILSEIKKY